MDEVTNATFWDDRYDDDDYVFGTQPNAFLRNNLACLPHGGHVLAVADGEGRNGVYLAQQGFAVTAIDISAKGLAKAARLAQQRGVSLDLQQVDIARYEWPENAFDAVVAIFIQFAAPDLREEIFTGIARCLKPGGVLLLQGYRPEQLEYGTGGPPNAENMYTEAMLRKAFKDWHIDKLESHDSEIHEGSGHGGMSALIDLVARRPE